MKTATNVANMLSRFLAWCSLASITVTMFLVVADVAVRLIGKGKGVYGTYEIVECLFCVIIYGGFAFCQTRQGHMHVTMVLYKLPRIPCFLIWGFASLVSAAMGVVLTIACWQQGLTVMNQGIYSPLIHVPKYPFQFFAGVCMIFFSLVLLLDGIKAILALFSEDHARDIRSHWVG